MIQIPEVALKHLLDAILARIKDDYVNNIDKSKTFLYKCFNGVISGNYNFLDQAVKIMNRTVDDPRTIDTRLLFDRERASLPTVHVTMPPESPFSDGIGFDEGYQDAQFDDDNNPTSVTSYLTRGYASKFELLITGGNTFEVLIIFYCLKLALINNVEGLEINGFRNPKIYGGDMRINDQIAPSPAYMRILTIDSFFELSVPRFESISIIDSINFSGKAYI